MLRIGLTGGIGSGKSTVCTQFSELGIPVLDADEIARQVVTPNSKGLTQLIQTFGTEILQENGELNRTLLREKVFQSEEKRLKLNEILHPLIYAEIEQKISQLDAPYCIVAIPLLIETAQCDRFDRILVIDCDERQQLDRVMARNPLSETEVKAIMDRQCQRSERLKYADDIVRNDGSYTELAVKVKKLHNLYSNLAKSESIPA
jgi:dephospho-CoA kinase